MNVSRESHEVVQIGQLRLRVESDPKDLDGQVPVGPTAVKRTNSQHNEGWDEILGE